MISSIYLLKIGGAGGHAGLAKSVTVPASAEPRAPAEGAQAPVAVILQMFLVYQPPASTCNPVMSTGPN